MRTAEKSAEPPSAARDFTVRHAIRNPDTRRGNRLSVQSSPQIRLIYHPDSIRITLPFASVPDRFLSNRRVSPIRATRLELEFRRVRNILRRIWGELGE